MNDDSAGITGFRSSSRRHLNRSEIDRLLDGLAVGSGRTRETLDAELAMLRVAEGSSVDEHLTFSEVVALHELDPDRHRHVDNCQFCKAMVETTYVDDISVADFENKVRLQLERTPRSRSGRLAAWTIATVAVVASGLFANAYRERSAEVATLRAAVDRQTIELAGLLRDRHSSLVIANTSQRIIPVPPSSRMPEGVAQASITAAMTAEKLRVLEEVSRRLNAEIVRRRVELATLPDESQHVVAPDTAARLTLATDYAEMAADLVDDAPPKNAEPPWMRTEHLREALAHVAPKSRPAPRP